MHLPPPSPPTSASTSASASASIPFSPRPTKFVSPATGSSLFDDAFSFFSDITDAMPQDSAYELAPSSSMSASTATTPTPTIASTASPMPAHYYLGAYPAPLSPSSSVSASSANTSPSLGPTSYDFFPPPMALPYAHSASTPLPSSYAPMDPVDSYDLANNDADLQLPHYVPLQTPLETTFPRAFRANVYDAELSAASTPTAPGVFLSALPIPAILSPVVSFPLTAPMTPTSNGLQVHKGAMRARSQSVSMPTLSPMNSTTHKRRANAGTRPRPYACHMCDSSFTRRSHLHRHCNTVHNRTGPYVRGRRSSPNKQTSQTANTTPTRSQSPFIEHNGAVVAATINFAHVKAESLDFDMITSFDSQDLFTTSYDM